MFIKQQSMNPSLAKTVLSEERLCSWVLRKVRSLNVPSSVYRVQLNKEFTFKDATALVPYWKALGVEAIYCSPYFQAVPESMHGYNVADPNRINTEIGTPEEYQQFCDALSSSGMGHIVDVVPNHMGISGNNNQWWMDVLENGQSSVYAKYFDIEWESAKSELKGKVLLPILGDFYGRVLENQEIRLAFEKGAFSVHYYERRLPIDPQTYPSILEHDMQELELLLGKEHPDLSEYLSVATVCRNLPANTEQRPEKIVERNREKEIVKQRLAGLCERSLIIRDFITSRIVIFNGVKGAPESLDLLHAVLDRQAYRLSLWSVAAQEINYRRFFNINDLAALRVEDEKVFQHYHDFLFSLVRESKVTGLRIDHPDGLYDPPAYFRALQRECLLQMILAEWDESARDSVDKADPVDVDAARKVLDKLLSSEFATAPGFFVVVEKILDRRENLPDNWNVSGTVGYDFMNLLNGLFIDRRHEKDFADLYEEYIGYAINFEDLVYSKKKLFGLVHMAGEINALGYRLDQISETNRMFRDFTRNDLTLAIREVIASFPVYRTYLSPDAIALSEKDIKYVSLAIKRAKKRTPALNPAIYDFLKEVLLLETIFEKEGEEERLYKDFVLRFQQLTGPIMAKGVEDTSFYVYNRLLSLNEVGGDPFHFGVSHEEFHTQNLERNKRWPGSFLASSTHDTKRSEDVRMRISVLSEVPDEWRAKIDEWATLNQGYKTIIDGVAEPRRNTEYFIYQTLLGAWPDQCKNEDLPALNERLWEVILKSIREAKIYTSWSQPDLEYEEAVKFFTRSIFKDGLAGAFGASFCSFQKRLSFCGKLNSLSATLLKIASPGVVDTYQGDELWNYCLVDPDNRRRVDFQKRLDLWRMMEEESKSGKTIDVLLRDWADRAPDMIKLWLLTKSLQFRRQHKELFVGGEYIPARVQGELERNIIALVRRKGDGFAIAAAARFFTELIRPETGDVLTPSLWRDTRIILPEGVDYPKTIRDVITGVRVPVLHEGSAAFVKASDVFQYTYTGLLSSYEE